MPRAALQIACKCKCVRGGDDCSVRGMDQQAHTAIRSSIKRRFGDEVAILWHLRSALAAHGVHQPLLRAIEAGAGAPQQT